MEIKPILHQMTGFFGNDYAWVVQVFIVVFVVLMVNFFLKRFLNRLQRQLEKTDNPWDDALIEAARKPAVLAVWIIGITFATDIILDETGAAIFGASGAIRSVGVIMTLIWFLVRLVQGIEQNIIAKSERLEGEDRIDRATVEALGKLVRLAVLITGGLVMLQTLGYSISGVLAFGGIGGIAIGFAAKDLLANFFGGLMVYLDRPFAVGDWIRSPDRELEGTVEYIGWRLTRIRTFDKRPIYVPNAVFTSVVVENPSRMSHRRIYETIGIRYDDISKMSAIVADVKKMLQTHAEIDQKQTMIVNFNAFAASSCDFFVYTFTKTTNWIHYHEIKHEVLLKISAIIEGHKAEIAFPTSTLHIPDAISVAANAVDPQI